MNNINASNDSYKTKEKEKEKIKERKKRGVGHMWVKSRPNVITCNHVTPIMNLICECGRGEAKF